MFHSGEQRVHRAGLRAQSGPLPSPGADAAVIAGGRLHQRVPHADAVLLPVRRGSVETSRFRGEGERTPFTQTEALRDHLEALAAAAPPTALNALRHAARHGLRCGVTVIPFTSIIEQTAAVYREALGNDAGVLKHRAAFAWQAAVRTLAAKRARDDAGGDPLTQPHLAAENCGAAVVVTTAVQPFESLFANTPSRCTKLHNPAKSVVVLDEAQMLRKYPGGADFG